MRFTCEKLPLTNALSAAVRTVSPKSNIPALEGIYLRAGEYLTLSGYNMETGITVRVDANVTECGTCVMPAKLFFDIVRKLPDEDISVSVDENLKFSIRSGISSFTIMAMNAEDYPQLPDVEYNNGVQIPQKALKSLISGTIFCVAQTQARPILTGCLIEVEDDAITMVSVDGFRLARRCYHPLMPTGRTMKFVVPGNALREVEKLLEEEDSVCTFTLGDKHILFEIDNITVVSRILVGEFMDWRKVMPQEAMVRLCGNVSLLNNTIERVSLIINEKVKSPVRCLFGKDSARFATVTTVGSAQDECALAGEGNNLEIGFNCRYLLEALRAVPTDEVMLEMTKSLNPIVLRPCEDSAEDFSYMVLPVRIMKEG